MLEYWRAQESKAMCSNPGCSKPAIVWTRRRSFCGDCAPPSALVLAYRQLRERMGIDSRSPSNGRADVPHKVWRSHCGRKVEYATSDGALDAIKEIVDSGRLYPGEVLQAYQCELVPKDTGHWHVGHAPDSGPPHADTPEARRVYAIRTRLRDARGLREVRRESHWSRVYADDVAWLLDQLALDDTVSGRWGAPAGVRPSDRDDVVVKELRR